MTSVAFFRNLNQGQRGNPTTAALLEALGAAGARDLRPVRGNGTVLFTSADPEATAAAARASLAPWDDVVFVRESAWLAELLGAAMPDDRTEITLFDPSVTAPPQRGKRCEIVSSGPGYAVVLNDSARQSDGTPTVERMLGVPATSRGVPTLRRVVASA